MIIRSALTVLLAQFAATSAEQIKRQATDEAAFSSAAAQLISLYVPASVVSAIGSAASAAGSVTGDAADIAQSALTATAPPPWLTALPAQYSPNLESLASAIDDLRGYAETGIGGAPRVETRTDEEGNTVVTIVPGTGTATATGEGSSSGEATGGASASTLTGDALSSVISSINSELYRTTPSTQTASSTDSSGLAVPTRISPAAAGIVGFMGFVLAL